jgi:hypothetical protein
MAEVSPQSRSLLLVAPGLGGTCLVAENGSPAWPLADLEDAAAVGRIAEVFGATLSWTHATERAREPTAPAEVVAALGATFRDAARLHSHLTGREVRYADDFASLVQGRRPAVVVTGPDALTTELLDWLYDSDDHSAPGIICAGPGAPVLRQVLVRAAAAVLSGTEPAVLREVFPTLPLSTLRDELTDVVGGAACVAKRRQMVTRGSGVLTVMTHSDGVDAFLGPGLSICAMPMTGDRPGPSAAPRCALTGFCHRHELPVSEVLASNTILAPDSFVAQVLVWDVCFGVMPAGSVVDPRWGIGQRLIGSALIGALLTNWQIVLSSPEHASGLGREIATGVPVGEALQRFNRIAPRRDRSHRMCLFGDPRVRLPPCERPQLPDNPARGKQSAYTRQAEQPTPSSLLRLAMAEAVRAGPDNPHVAFAHLALHAIRETEVAAARGGLPRAPAGLRATMRTTVLHYALRRGKMLESWLPFAQDLQRMAYRTCPVCGRRAEQIRAMLRTEPAIARRLLLCAICGVLEDAPDASDVGFTLDDRKLTLRGSLSSETVTVGVLVASSYGADTIRLDWPCTPDGMLAPDSVLPRRLPPGPLRLSLFFVWDTTFAVVSRMTRDVNWDAEDDGDSDVVIRAASPSN